MSHAMARAAIERKLFDWAKTKNLPTVFNVQKADLSKPVFLKGSPLPASARTECLQGDEITYIGLYQVMVCCDPAQPFNTAETLINEIQSLFPVDSDIGVAAFNGSITDAVDQGPTIVEDSRYNVPVTIPYRGVVST